MLEWLVAAAIAVGILGCIVPILPGAYVVAAAVLVWAIGTGGAQAWAVAAGAVLIVAGGQVLKYLLPGKRLKTEGVPGWVLGVGGIAGVVGFFVIPVVGLFIGFVAGVFVAEAVRLRTFRNAWPTTLAAMKAAGWSMLIELASAVFAGALWVVAVLTFA